MKIIPVIDILNGKTVHAVKGKRAEYQPLKSSLSNSADPLAVASAFKAAGFRELYIADLDAIMEKGTSASAIGQIASKTGLELMVDAGISNLQQAQELFKNKVSKIIIGTETLPNLNFIKEAVDNFGSKKIVVSLDLKNGNVLCKSKEVASMDILALAEELQRRGIAELIVLDLARVGSEEGVDFNLLKEMRSSLNMNLLVGGGVRGMDDLLKLKELGADGVLLATALHSGKISVETLREEGLL